MNDEERYGKPVFYDSKEMYDMAKLTAGQRDELLIRLDQKVQDSLPRIEGHLERINGHLDDHSYRLRTVEVRQQERTKPSKKAIGGYTGGILAIVVALWKAFTNGN